MLNKSWLYNKYMKTTPTRLLRYSFIVILSVVIMLAVYRLTNLYLPNNINPLKPLFINDEPGLMTKHKIRQLKKDAESCFAVLANSDLKYQLIPDKITGESCAFQNVVMLEQSTISYGGDIVLKCPALVALVIWEKHDLQPLAIKKFGQKIIRIRHYGTYACRNVNNAKQGRRSQHAYANAIDIAGFVLADGSEISILKDWNQNTENGEFLASLHESACQRFITVLGPNYNDFHKNHFHFDHGGWSICR